MEDLRKESYALRKKLEELHHDFKEMDAKIVVFHPTVAFNCRSKLVGMACRLSDLKEYMLEIDNIIALLAYDDARDHKETYKACIECLPKYVEDPTTPPLPLFRPGKPPCMVRGIPSPSQWE